jgi:hypothetical protein
MSFLPEEDQEFLDSSGIRHELLTERTPEGAERCALLLPGFVFTGNLRAQADGALKARDTCDLLVVIPDGYATTKLDSFYTVPHFKRSDGADPQNATGDTPMFGKSWQFWSRHLDDADWRVGIDGLRTFINYIRGELKNA